MSGQFPNLDVTIHEISAEELKDRLDRGEQVTLLDTRRPADFETWHITHDNLTAVNIPFTEFLSGDDPADSVPEGVPEGPLVTCCAKGISSVYVAEFLARAGWEIEALADGMEGWARLYEYTELDADTDATVAQYYRPSSGCLAYLVVSGGEAAVIDPLRAFVTEYVQDVKALGATLTYALDTHVHADHLSGLRMLAAQTGAEMVLPTGAKARGLAFDATFVEDGDTITVGDVDIEAVHIPGHTTEMTGYRVGRAFITGDTLFTDSVARPDLEEGAEGAPDAARRLYDTLQEIADLPDETLILPAHTSPSARPDEDGVFGATVGDLRERLAPLSMEREAFVEYVLADMPPRPNNYEAIIAANLGRHEVNRKEAFELELGPNNCAADAP
jgi:glyoxylase-like metal-dependent hydrolase (beta-lactamase superfamily II)